MKTSGLAWAALLFGVCAGLLGAPRGTADDGPGLAPKPKAVPPQAKPKVADGAGAPAEQDLVQGLLAEDPAERQRAERFLAQAPWDVLQKIVLALRDRFAKPLETPKPPGNVAISIELRLLEILPCHACSLFNLESCATPSSNRLLTAAEAEALLHRVSSDADTQVASAEITTYSGQRGTMEVLNRKAYVSDFDIEVAQSPSGPIADPIVENAIEGVVVNFKARDFAGGTQVNLELDLDARRIVDPIAEEKLTIPGMKTEVVIQRPEIVGARWIRTVSVPNGGNLLVALPSGFAITKGKDRAAVLLVKATIVSLDDLSKDPGTVLVPSIGVPPADVPVDAAKAAVQTTLESKRVKGAQFTDASLLDVASYLRTVTGLEMRLSTAVSASPAASTKINTPAIADASALELLNLVIAPLGLAWEARDGGITIVVASDAPSSEPPPLPAPGTKPPSGR